MNVHLSVPGGRESLSLRLGFKYNGAAALTEDVRMRATCHLHMPRAG